MYTYNKVFTVPVIPEIQDMSKNLILVGEYQELSGNLK